MVWSIAVVSKIDRSACVELGEVPRAGFDDEQQGNTRNLALKTR